MSDMLRITGMVSGMDTDATVKKLISLERTKVDKAEQAKQVLEWQQEQYRDISSMFKTFQSDFLDVLKPATNFRSETAFNVFSATSSSDAVSVTTSGSSNVGTIEIRSITRLATKDKYASDSAVVGNLKGSAAMAPIADILAKVQAGEDTLTFNLDGVSKTITLNPAAHNNYANYSDFVADVNAQLSSAYPSMEITASESGGVLSFNIMRGGVAESGHKLSISSANTGLLADLKFESGQSNVLNLDNTLANAFGFSGSVALEINGKSDFGITAADTIDEAINKINNANVGVKLSYDEITDSFKMESTKEGAANAISFTDNGGLLNAFKLNNHTAAVDAEFTIQTENGPMTTTRSSNTFEIDGNKITLNQVSNDPIKIDVKAETKQVKDNIVKFVDSYNKLIDTLHKKVNEKRYRTFTPLTKEQKKELDEGDEKAWQDKAKSGLLRGDSTLSSIASKMRQALYEAVEGVGISLSDIGITTSKDYNAGGKLIIDETKLDKALTEKPGEVMKLFTQDADYAYLDKDHVSERYAKSGLAERLNDIVNDNIRTVNGKGYLIRKAGQKDTPDTSSNLYKKIKQADEKIDKLLEMLSKKEEKYYRQFGRMEAMLQKYNSQSAWLMKQFGG